MKQVVTTALIGTALSVMGNIWYWAPRLKLSHCQGTYTISLLLTSFMVVTLIMFMGYYIGFWLHVKCDYFKIKESDISS